MRKGMGAAPPAGRVGGIPPVGRPAVARVFLQPVELAHVLRVAHGLEHAHVLPAGKDIGPVDPGVDPDHAPGGVLLLVQLAVRQLGGQGSDEIPPDQGLVGDLRRACAWGFSTGLQYRNAVPEIFRRLPWRRCRHKTHGTHNRSLYSGIDAVAGEAAAQAVASGRAWWRWI